VGAKRQAGKKTEPVQPVKVAVYVTGNDTTGVNDFVGDYLTDAIVRSGKYTAVERTYDFLKELSNEQEYQRTGNVDDNQISKLGRQFGVQLVCVAKVSGLEGGKYLSARVIDVETGTVTKSAKPVSFTMEKLSETCEDITRQLFGSAMARTFGKPKPIGN
jgi:hypothetical protein